MAEVDRYERTENLKSVLEWIVSSRAGYAAGNHYTKWAFRVSVVGSSRQSSLLLPEK
ncbi:hypothetical protein P7H19_21030 [Paenibacillus larvae]|nr:hypothetical protein [Paenibacillus larvae]MDT2238244.1 hypothetical protein [Paenibacillus larvae]